jgi:hypothetical protein
MSITITFYSSLYKCLLAKPLHEIYVRKLFSPFFFLYMLARLCETGHVNSHSSSFSIFSMCSNRIAAWYHRLQHCVVHSQGFCYSYLSTFVCCFVSCFWNIKPLRYCMLVKVCLIIS